MIRLLAKDEITRRQSDDKIREANEMSKLTRQVDNLRQLRAKTDKDYEEFRLKSLSAIGDEIRKLNEKKENLEKEIVEKKIKSERIISSLDEREKELNIRDENLELLLKQIEERIAGIKNQEKEVSKNLQGINKRVKIAELREKESTRLQDESILHEKEVFKTLESTRKEKYTFEKEKEALEANMAQREAFLNNKENVLSEKEEKLRSREIQIEKDKKWIADRRSLLKRNFDRLEKIKNSK